jgi:putative transposase
MLFRNDIFSLDSRRFRLLHLDENSSQAWAIDIDDEKAWPVSRLWSELKNLAPWSPTDASATPALKTIAATPAMLRVRDEALTRLGNIVNAVPAIFDPEQRGRLVREQAEKVGCTKASLYKYLRQWWLRGQSPAALLGNFSRCGGAKGLTARRGNSRKGKVLIYQVTGQDLAYFSHAAKAYLKDERLGMSDVFQTMLEERYTTLDGNGDAFIKPSGERPTYRQFSHWLRTTFSTEQRLRRKGDKDFARQHRAKLSTVLADCLGVGHYYEADASIADCYLVATEDVREIISKPTIYIIIDRKSRLIVGWYVGLENASWVCAMLAILSIAQDKQELCQRYGVRYDPEDWPAHRVFPKQFLADRGELFTHASTQLASDLDCIVTNVPSKRPDWKAVVECGFKQTRQTLANSSIPGYDPPENATRRQGKHYEKDACLTLAEFTTIILSAIIAHNRKLMGGYDLSLKEIGDRVEPSPIALWNHGVVTRAGLLPRYEEHNVRLALLPRIAGTVSDMGLKVQDCYYTCPELVERGWFVEGRVKRFEVAVSYDTRAVETVWVHNRDKPGEVFECTLNDHSAKYRSRGLSFAEVKALKTIEDAMRPSVEQSVRQTQADLHRVTNAIVKNAKQRLAKAGKVSRSARKADTKAARAEELKSERLNTAARTATQKTSAKVISLPSIVQAPQSMPARPADAQDDTAGSTAPLSLAERIRQARLRATQG